MGVPRECVVATRELFDNVLSRKTDNPKSATRTSGGVSSLNNIFSGFMSIVIIIIIIINSNNNK